MKIPKVRYCSQCGTKMQMKLVGAEAYESFGLCGSYHPYDPYSEETGKRQYIRLYECPNTGRFFKWGHDYILEDKIITP